MAGDETMVAGARVSDEEPALQQPQDAMAMETIDKNAATEPQKDFLAGATTSTSTGPEPAAEATAKGKEKEHAVPISAQVDGATSMEDDTIQIEGGPTTASPDAALVCNITLLLPTGARHPYRIDEKYLAKRNVEIPEVNEAGEKDPFSVSIYKLKELILREWRDEWDGKPASPSSIRLIHFGKLLDDKEPLKKYQFSVDSPNVVHMSVKPAETTEDDEAAKTSGRDSKTREGSTGCCIVL